MDKDALGDRMKEYEGAFAQRRFMPLLPIVIRLDGRAFSTFTQGLRRPYDERLSRLMIDVTKACVAETGARVGYTQSDEITLVLHADTHDHQLYFDRKTQKTISVLAAFASVEFNRLLPARIPEKERSHPVFDGRAFNVPNLTEAANALLWRELDATKNSISMAARAYYEHGELHEKTGKVMQEMLFAKGVNWNDYPDFFKRGTYVRRVVTRTKYSPQEIEKLPLKHNARLNPDLEVERSEVREWPLPPLLRVHNRVEALFSGAAPVSFDDGAQTARDVHSVDSNLTAGRVH